MLDMYSLIFASVLSVVAYILGAYKGFRNGFIMGTALAVMAALEAQEEENETRAQKVSL